MTKELKHVGANIPEDLFWLFKRESTKRKDNTKEAIIKAIKLYVKDRKHSNK